jgi:hypothetical protein
LTIPSAPETGCASGHSGAPPCNSPMRRGPRSAWTKGRPSYSAPEPEKSFLVKLIEGVVHVLSRVPQALTIETPIVRAYVEGTEFVLGVSKSEAELWVFEGRVRYANPQGELEVRSGEGALARPGQAPVRRVLVKPREAVEWALYSLVDPRSESHPPALRATLSAYRANDLPAAFAALERVPAGDRDGDRGRTWCRPAGKHRSAWTCRAFRRERTRPVYCPSC